MKNFYLKKLGIALTVTTVIATVITGCRKNETPKTEEPTIKLQSYSKTPALVLKKPGFESLEVFSLFSSEDVFEQSPNYVFGGSADGAGTVKTADGNFVMMVNNEDNWSVSRITLDKNFKPVKGEYTLNSDGGQARSIAGKRQKSSMLMGLHSQGNGLCFVRGKGCTVTELRY